MSNPPIMIPGDAFPYVPRATDQISRFDQNGMTNLIFNMRTPDPDPTPETPDTHRFILRYGPTENTFDSTGAMVNVRAKLTEPLTAGIAETLVLVAKDLDGNDTTADPVGADEYTYNLDLNLFNTSDFALVSIPLEDFVLSEHVPRTDTNFGSGPGGFMFPGDESMTEFNLYEFGGLIPVGGGVLRLELDYMEIRLPELGEPGDYNGDGLVNAADYTEYRNHLGQTFQLDNEVAGVTPGMVTPEDYDAWKSRYGNGMLGGGGLANSPVPEPATLSLLAWLLAAAAMRRRTR
jgi:hypothetical protein